MAPLLSSHPSGSSLRRRSYVVVIVFTSALISVIGLVSYWGAWRPRVTGTNAAAWVARGADGSSLLHAFEHANLAADQRSDALALISSFESMGRKDLSSAGDRPPLSSSLLLPDFVDTPQCSGDALQGRMANYQEVVSSQGMRIVDELNLKQLKHRKNWEYIFIVSALERLDMLRPGRRGLVFAAGDEPLISYFASKGVAVVATDMFPDQAGINLWSGTGQHASSLGGLFKPDLVSKERFDKLVSFQHADMNHISPELHGKFDFVWSTCSLEHVGSISLGHRFALDSMEVLKPGGAAVHTVEFTLSSLDETVERGDTALWRKHDMQRLWEDHLSLGYEMQEPCWNAGGHLLDVQPDLPPYARYEEYEQSSAPVTHIKMMVGEFMCTSMGWVAQKPAARAQKT